MIIKLAAGKIPGCDTFLYGFLDIYPIIWYSVFDMVTTY